MEVWVVLWRFGWFCGGLGGSVVVWVVLWWFGWFCGGLGGSVVVWVEVLGFFGNLGCFLSGSVEV